MGHSILFKQCGSDRMTRRRSHAIDRIVIHYTATPASARNNAIYFSRNERQGSSARYFVGDITDEIYQSVAEGDTAWHAGNWLMNCRSVGIEAVSASEDYSEVEAGKLAWLVQTLMKRYGISEGGVIRRYDVTGKICPAPYIAAGRRAALRPRICRGAGSSDTVAAGSSGSGGSAPSGDVASLAWRVINEEFGNGEARKRALGSRYFEVQAEVNRILFGGGSGGSSSSGSGEVDIDALARTVINGDYGNGEERKRRLGSNYAAVQRCVSQMLS